MIGEVIVRPTGGRREPRGGKGQIAPRRGQGAQVVEVRGGPREGVVAVDEEEVARPVASAGRVAVGRRAQARGPLRHRALGVARVEVEAPREGGLQTGGGVGVAVGSRWVGGGGEGEGEGGGEGGGGGASGRVPAEVAQRASCSSNA